MKNPVIAVHRGKHRPFQSLVDMLAFEAMIIASVGAARKLTLPYDVAVTEFPCPACGFFLRADLDGYLKAIDSGRFPDRIIYRVLERGGPIKNKPIEGIGDLADRLKGATFALFVDRVIEWLRPQHSNYHSWPPTANFARVVRNAIVHGGTINIHSESAPIVSWRGISFGQKDAGDPVFSETFNLGDLIPLLLELDKELNSLGAPFDL